jgi:uncharacterized protein YjbI with pentapeptide repeats
MNKEKKHSNKCPICGRPTHKKSKYCIFHANAEEKTEKEFKKALKEYVNKIKKEDSDYDFKKFIFIGDIDFKKDLNVTVFKNAVFSDATFKGDAVFSDATFKRGSSAFFSEATFKGVAVSLEAALKKGGLSYMNAASGGIADFTGATFKKDAIFTGATFEDDADFKLKYFNEILNFSRIKVFSGKKLFIRLNDKRGKIFFERAYLEDAYLDISLIAGILIDFTDALLRNTKIKKVQIENHILQEKEKEFSKAKEIYLLLKNNFHSIGKYGHENWAFKKEKDMERKGNCHFKTLHRWIWSCFLNGIFGYGTQPFKVIISAILIITLFAFLFMTSGISNVGIEEITSNNFFDCMYFSTITFTTLGYGDFRPLEGLGRILAGSEAFIGAFMMALFVYTFARRTGGR